MKIERRVKVCVETSLLYKDIFYIILLTLLFLAPAPNGMWPSEGCVEGNVALINLYRKICGPWVVIRQHNWHPSFHIKRKTKTFYMNVIPLKKVKQMIEGLLSLSMRVFLYANIKIDLFWL